MDNVLTNAELKRRGVAGIESALARGPVHIYKRNRPTAVVLSEKDYQRLLNAQNDALPGMSALDWLVAHPSSGKLSKKAIDERMQVERSW